MTQPSKIKEEKAPIIIFVLEKTIWEHALKSKKVRWSCCLAALGMVMGAGTAPGLRRGLCMSGGNFLSARISQHWGCTLASQKTDLLKGRRPLGKGLSPMPQPDPASSFRKSESHSSRIKKIRSSPLFNFPLQQKSSREMAQPTLDAGDAPLPKLDPPNTSSIWSAVWSAVSSLFVAAPCGFQAHLIH